MPLSTSLPQQDSSVNPDRARCLHCHVCMTPGRGLFCSDACRAAYAAAVAATLKPLSARILSRREKQAGGA